MDKLFTGILILNWKNKSMRVIKKKHSNLSPYEIPVKIEIKVKLPEQKDIIAKGEVEIPEYKVNEMMIESI